MARDLGMNAEVLRRCLKQFGTKPDVSTGITPDEYDELIRLRCELHRVTGERDIPKKPSVSSRKNCHKMPGIQHPVCRIADGIEYIVNKFRLGVVSHAEFFFAKELSGFIEAAWDVDADNPSGIQMLSTNRFPIGAETVFGELVMMLNLEPVVHCLDRIIHRQRDGGRFFAELDVPTHPVDSCYILIGLFEDDLILPAEPAGIDWNEAVHRSAITECRHI